MMKKIWIEEWVLKMLWDSLPEGSAKNQLAVHEMKYFVREWNYEATPTLPTT